MDASGCERRRFPRVRLLRPFHGQTVAVREPFTLRDLSLGGFSVEAPVPFLVGETHPFAFSSDRRNPVVLHGMVRHCLRLERPDSSPMFVAGFEFVRSESHDARVIAEMVRTGSASNIVPVEAAAV